MADEIPLPGDMWGEPGTIDVMFIARTVGSLDTLDCIEANGMRALISDEGKFAAAYSLLFRPGNPYQSPTPSQGGDVITVEIVVAGEPGKRRIGWEEGETVEKQLNWARQCGLHPHDCTIRAALPVRTTPLIEGAVELPPVTATPS